MCSPKLAGRLDESQNAAAIGSQHLRGFDSSNRDLVFFLKKISYVKSFRAATTGLSANLANTSLNWIQHTQRQSSEAFHHWWHRPDFSYFHLQSAHQVVVQHNIRCSGG